MDSTASHRQAANRERLVPRYLEVRRWRRRLNDRLVSRLSGPRMKETARLLGMLRHGVFCFESEDEMSVLMDHALHSLREDGLNEVQRLLLDEQCVLAREERPWLAAMCETRFSVYQVREPLPGVGVEIEDLLWDQSEFIFDVNFSRTCNPGLLLAMRLCGQEGIRMTTGTALPVSETQWPHLLRQILRVFGRQGKLRRPWSAAKDTQLATLVIRSLLKSGASQNICFVDPT